MKQSNQTTEQILIDLQQVCAWTWRVKAESWIRPHGVCHRAVSAVLIHGRQNKENAIAPVCKKIVTTVVSLGGMSRVICM
jgi:hypothetical protein